MNNSFPGIVQIIITASLLLHGIAHAIGLVALIGQAAANRTRRKIEATSWLFSEIRPRTISMTLILFWLLAAMMFIGASASSWGVVISSELWSLLALVGAIVSTLGVILVGGKWPGSPSFNRAYLNSAVAMVMNVLILTAMIWLQWLPTGWILG